MTTIKHERERKNGKPYAAFGLLWNDLGSKFMDHAHAELFDDVLVSEIDRCDTSSNTNLLSSSIDYFNPKWNSETGTDEAFERAVKLFTPMLENMINHFKVSSFIPRYCRNIQDDIISALENLADEKKGLSIYIKYSSVIDAWNYQYKDILEADDENDLFIKTFLSQVGKTYGKYKTSPFVLGMSLMKRNQRIRLLKHIMEERLDSIKALAPAKVKCEEQYHNSVRKDIITFDSYVPNSCLKESYEDVKAVVFPSDRGGYNILSLAKKGSKRFCFPDELRGQQTDILNDFSQGLLFVHQSGFLATCNSLNSAICFFDKCIGRSDIAYHENY